MRETTILMNAIVNGVTYVHTFTRYTAIGGDARAASCARSPLALNE